jgi:hypothetical protein
MHDCFAHLSITRGVGGLACMLVCNRWEALVLVVEATDIGLCRWPGLLVRERAGFRQFKAGGCAITAAAVRVGC